MMCAIEAKRLAAVTPSSLKDLRSDTYFDGVWEELLAKVTEFDCEEPVLPLTKPLLLILILHQSTCIVHTILKF